jgi:thiamine-monophosphate kinase
MQNAINSESNQMKEFELIQAIKDIADSKLNIIGDDTAVINETGTVLTCDTLVENTHFKLNTHTPFELGYKAAAVNLSDIAASGGICEYLLVSLAMPQYIDIDFVREFYNGMIYLTEQFGVNIVGGDLTRCDVLVVTVTATGKTKKKTGRKFAKIGQKIITTGDYGASYTGLLLLQGSKNLQENDTIHNIISRHTKPWPRIHEAQYFLNNTDYQEYCMMDTSDGLADALYQISTKSEKRFNIYMDRIPIAPELFDIHRILNVNSFQAALYGGEDFELIFTCNEEDLEVLYKNTDFQFTCIGDIIEGKCSISLISENTVIELDEYLLEEEATFKHF